MGYNTNLNLDSVLLTCYFVSSLVYFIDFISMMLISAYTYGKQKTIDTDNRLPNHKRTPSEEKPNNQKETLRVHKTTYTGEKPFRCKTCDKCFTRRGYLTVHERSHTGEKPYQCKTCNKCSTVKGSLQRHEILHTGEKPYECKTCHKCFSRKDSLQSHKMSHTGEIPYQCRICDKVFSARGTLKRHERNLRVHKISHSVKMPYDCSTLLFSENKESNDNDISVLEESSSLDFGHAGTEFTCWICQEELSSASLLGEHYDDHMK